VLSEFLEQRVAPDRMPRFAGLALVHGHCHHKSVLKFGAEESVIRKLGLEAEVLASGCCGMAGSFGFEADKYEVSVAVGERNLLPAVRQAAPSTIVMADGFSCREQIAQLTGRRALHLAEVIQLAKSKTRLSGNPEAELMAEREGLRRRTRMRAAVTLAGIVLGGFAVFTWAKRR